MSNYKTVFFAIGILLIILGIFMLIPFFVQLIYLEKNNLGIPDTALLMEGDKTFVYKIIENNMIKKTEVKTNARDKGNLEVVSGLSQGDKVVAEGLSKVRPHMKIKPIIKAE